MAKLVQVAAAERRQISFLTIISTSPATSLPDVSSRLLPAFSNSLTLPSQTLHRPYPGLLDEEQKSIHPSHPILLSFFFTGKLLYVLFVK